MVLKIFPAVLAAVLLANGAQAQTCSVSLPGSLIVGIELMMSPQFTDADKFGTTCCNVGHKPPKPANRR